MKTMLIMALLATAIACNAQKAMVQDYTRHGETWIKTGSLHKAPDTLTTIYAYGWKRNRIVAVQNYKRINGKWKKSGKRYPLPDSVTVVHLFTNKNF